MKKLFTMSTVLLIAVATNAAVSMTNIWAKVEAYPIGSGKVYLTSNDLAPQMESGWGETSESRFTMLAESETRYENNVVIPGFFGIVQVDGGTDYDCVGLVKQIREDGDYTIDDYYQGGPAIYDKEATLFSKVPGDYKYERPVTVVNEQGVLFNLNSGREGWKYEGQDVLTEEEHGDVPHNYSEAYWFYHDRIVERAKWPEAPTKVYALFKKKVSVVMDKSGQMVFSSKENLKVQKDSGLQALVVYTVEDGIGRLKATDSIPANLGVVLRGEPGREYKLDRIPSPLRYVYGDANGPNVYNDLLCSIFGFYPESEILYRFGNYNYGEGFYKVPTGQTADSDYLTIAITGGTPPAFFTIDGFTTAVSHVEAAEAAPAAMYDLQGRRLTEEPAKGVYIQSGKKVVK